MARRSHALIVVGALAFGLVGELQQLADGRVWWWSTLVFAVGAAFVVVGALVWGRRSSSAIGPLSIGAGVAWFVSAYATVPEQHVAWVARSFEGWHDVLLATLVLAYPSGRITGPLARLLIAALAIAWVVWTLIRFVFNRPVAWYGDFATADARSRFITDREIVGAVGEAIAWSSAVLGLAILAILAIRWARASNVARRKLAPVLFAGAVLAAGFAALVPLRDLTPGNPANQVGDTWATVTFGLLLARAVIPVGLMVGLLELRISRSAVADLVVELGDTPTPRRLRDALRQALGDETLEVFLPDGEGWRDDTGRSSALPAVETGRAVTALERDGRPVAALLHDPALLDEPGLVAAVASAVRLAVENERLEAEVRAQLEEVRASRARIVAAGDDARRRLERDLHDGAQQQLVALSLLLRSAQRQASASGDPALRGTLETAANQLAAALSELRSLARGIHPAVLTEAGLTRALESLATRSSTPVDLHSTLARRLPPSIEATAYFVVSEALANAEKHASASGVRVTAAEESGVLRVEVSDDGTGGADSARGSGLRGLEDRVAAHGGRLTVESRPQLGTRVSAEIPCAS